MLDTINDSPCCIALRGGRHFAIQPPKSPSEIECPRCKRINGNGVLLSPVSRSTDRMWYCMTEDCLAADKEIPKKWLPQ